ncbi:MAG: Gfo/Idh/MocA family protein [Chthoniobacterales bacterium]
MSDTTINFAIVGAGSIADFHAAGIQGATNTRLHSVFNRSFEKAQAFTEKHGGKACKSLEELLADPELDAVCITSPSGTHAEVAVAALRAGKHVLCEKPLDISLDRVDAILDAAKDSGKILAAVFQSRLAPNAMRLKEAIEKGRFGKITFASCHVKWWRDQAYYDASPVRGTWASDGGGCLMNQGIHAIDTLQWLVGKPVEVSAMMGSIAHENIEVEDVAAATLRFQNGALGVIEGSTSAWPGLQKRIEISGDKGSVVLEDDALKVWKFQDELPEDKAILAEGSEDKIMGSGRSNPRAISTEGHRLLIDDLAQAIRRNGQPAISGPDARNAVEIVLAVYQSAREGRFVKLS